MKKMNFFLTYDELSENGVDKW